MNTLLLVDRPKTASQLRKTRHVPGVFFRCSLCQTVKPVGTKGGTGYGRDNRNRLVCYACCATQDRASMLQDGKAFLYLSDGMEVTNWPGTLRFKAHYQRKSWHNFAGRNGRTDVWFTGPNGTAWHGVNIGDNQVLRCKRIKQS